MEQNKTHTQENSPAITILCFEEENAKNFSGDMSYFFDNLLVREIL